MRLLLKLLSASLPCLFCSLLAQAADAPSALNKDLIFSNGIYSLTAKAPNQVIKKAFTVRGVASLYLMNVSGDTRILIASERRNIAAEKCQTPDVKKIGSIQILQVKESKENKMLVCAYTGKNKNGFVQVRQYAAPDAKEVILLTGIGPSEATINGMFANLKVNYVSQK